MRALRGESAFSFYPLGVCSPAEFLARVAWRAPKEQAPGVVRARNGVGGTRRGGRLSRSSGLAAGALGSGGNYRRAESDCPGAVGSRRARWARGALQAVGAPSKIPPSIYAATTIYLHGQDYLSTWARLAIYLRAASRLGGGAFRD